MQGRKKIISECTYIDFMNNRLNYKCKKCNGKSCKSVNKLIEKFPNTYKFCDRDLKGILGRNIEHFLKKSI